MTGIQPEERAYGEDGRRRSRERTRKEHQALPPLISSTHLDGLPVFSREGEKLGTVHSFMIDRHDGRVDLVIMSFGGFLGVGESYHALPWSVLTPDPDHDGYLVDVDKDVLNGGPTFKLGSEPNFDRSYIERVWSYYGLG